MKPVVLAFISSLLCSSLSAQNLDADTKYSVELNPFALLFDAKIDAEVIVKLSSQIAVGPTLFFDSESLTGATTTLMAAGVRGDFYASGNAFATGTYSKAKIEFGNVNHSVGGCSTDTSSTGLTAAGGYQWYFNSGFNTHLGLKYKMSRLNKQTSNCSDSELEDFVEKGIGVDFGLGWAF